MSYKIDITLNAEFVRADEDPEHLLEYLSMDEIKKLQTEDDPTIEEIDAHFLKNNNYIEYVMYIIQYALEFSDCVLDSDYKTKLREADKLLKQAKAENLPSYKKLSFEYMKFSSDPVYDEKVLKSISYLGNGKISLTVYTDDEEASLLIEDFNKGKKKLYKLQMYIVDQIKEDSLEDGPYEADAKDSPFIYESKRVPGVRLGEFDHRNDDMEVRVEKL